MKVRVANSRFLNGLGVFTTKDLNKCEVITKLEYVREVTKEQPLAENEKYEHQTYLPDGRIFLVAEPMRYTNHSCSPNSYLYSVEEQYFIIAKHQIAEGTEITIDYELNAVDGDTWECLCKECFLLVLNFLVIGEATLEAHLITATKSLRGGCASSRLNHGWTDSGTGIYKCTQFTMQLASFK